MNHRKCQVFTPDVYADEMLNEIGYYGEKILGKLFLENSVGEGDILLVAVKRYILSALDSNIDLFSIKEQLESNFIAFEIDKKILKTCLINLDELANRFGIENVKWNVKNSDYLVYSKRIDASFIVGNPPYITYQEIDNENREFLRDTFLSCKKGKFDYCYAFIEKSLNDLNDKNGRMAYFIPSSVFKNAFGQNLRNIMLPSLKKIIDYKHRTVFKGALTSPAIIICEKGSSIRQVEYIDRDLELDINIAKSSLESKWIFSNLEQVVNPMHRFGDFFRVSNSVATLLNEAFVLKKYDVIEDSVVVNGFRIEREIVRNAASPRFKAYGKNEKIIFPYRYDNNGNLIHYSEEEFLRLFPNTARYLNTFREKIDARKADGKWFEYGRSQSLRHINQEKLLISSVITEKLKVYNLAQNEIPYSGFYIIPTGERNFGLEFAKQILESEEFHSYVIQRAINANGKSVRISVNDIKNFPVMIN